MLTALRRPLLHNKVRIRFVARQFVSSATNDSSDPKNESTGSVKSFEERLDICKSCSHGKKRVYGYPTYCDSCGCQIQAKAFFEVFRCPEGKW